MISPHLPGRGFRAIDAWLSDLCGLSLALVPCALIMVCQPMPPSEPSRVFISYARKDGATLAQRLQKDLKEKGFDAWLDTQRIAGGATWTKEIEHALDKPSTW